MKKIKFKDFLTLQRGFDLPKAQRMEGKYPLVASTKVDGSHNVSKVKAPGVVTGRSGSLGSVQYITKDFWPLNTTLWVKDFKGNNEKYVYYALQTLDLAQYNSGAGVPTLNRNHLDELMLDVHGRDEQVQIEKLLSHYDNLIENNNRRIAILEEMAQSLYREWFVNFRYPGHANQPDCSSDNKDSKPNLIDFPLGPIPEGWEVKSAQEAITINPRTQLDKTSESPFVGMSGLAQNSMVIGDVIQKQGNSGAKFINGDTLFARITPCLQNGKTGYVQFLTDSQPVGFGSTEFIVLRESECLSSEFIYLLSRSNNFRVHAIQSMTGATGRQRVHNDCFASLYIVVPPRGVMDQFTRAVSPMFKSIFNLSKRNENLKQQRDMLLPKLISGQIQLKD
jgi:type I restriction enzyme S subunit